jgi:hypothetical protein
VPPPFHYIHIRAYIYVISNESLLPYLYINASEYNQQRHHITPIFTAVTQQESDKRITTSISMLVNVISNESLLPYLHINASGCNQQCHHPTTIFTAVVVNVIRNVTNQSIPPHQWLWMSSAMSPPYHYLHSSGCECDQECNKPITTSTSMLVNVISNVTTLPLSSQQWLWMWSGM